MKKVIFSAILVAGFSFAMRAQTAETAPTVTKTHSMSAATCTPEQKAACTKSGAACCAKAHGAANGTAMAKVDKAVKKEDPKQK